MRTISFVLILALCTGYCLFSAAGWTSLRMWVSQRFPGQEKCFKRFFFSWAAAMALSFFLFQGISTLSGGSSYYMFYFYLNAFFCASFISAMILAVAAVPSRLGKWTVERGRVPAAGLTLAAGIWIFLAVEILLTGSSFRVREVSLEFDDLPASFNGLRIVQISDLHSGSFHNQAMLYQMAAMSHRLDPDILVFTGDLVNNYSMEAEGWTEILSRFDAQGGKFAVRGNHDYGDYSTWSSETQRNMNKAGIADAYRSSGFRLLQNEAVLLIRGNDSLYLSGVENWGKGVKQYSDLGKASETIPTGAFSILLTHEPGLWFTLSGEDNPYQLTLAGHTHGFQWGLGRMEKTRKILFSLGILWQGLYEESGRFMYVNAGIGIAGVHLRIAMPPEITLITLKKRQNSQKKENPV